VALRNLLVERARHSRVIPLERLGEIDELSIPSDEIGPDRRVSARQELEQLNGILERLPPQCRRVFELRKLEGLSQRETAAALGISERTVEKHLAKAFARVMQLRRQMTGTEAEQHDSTSDSDDTRREQD
jgi:RNA polymerase sigma-70 factor (ECF subfamily)